MNTTRIINTDTASLTDELVFDLVNHLIEQSKANNETKGRV